MKKDLEHARPLDVWIWSNKPAVVKTADLIFKRMCREKGVCKNGKWSFPFKDDKSLTAKQVKKHLKVILTDLFVCNRHDNMQYIMFSRRACHYRASERFNKIFLSLKHVAFVTDFLAEHKYIEFHIGYRSPDGTTRLSRMKAAKELVRCFTRYEKRFGDKGMMLRRNPSVILRDENKQTVDCDYDNIKAKTIVKNTNRINKLLDAHNIGMDVFGLLNKDVMADYKEHYTTTAQRYHRVFNDGRQELDHGGRFYGHWTQSIRSEHRQFITIDGRETIELDYSCLHISMLYGEKGLVPPNGDQYDLTGYMPEYNQNYRKVVKKAVNIFINAKDETQALRALHDETKDFYEETGLPKLQPKRVLAAIREKHAPIAGDFCSHRGIELQNKDAQLAEEIMLTFMERDIPVLCVHDSFIIDRRYANTLKKLMEEKFNMAFGYTPTVSQKIERTVHQERLLKLCQEDELFEYLDRYTPYHAQYAKCV